MKKKGTRGRERFPGVALWVVRLLELGLRCQCRNRKYEMTIEHAIMVLNFVTSQFGYPGKHPTRIKQHWGLSRCIGSFVVD